MSQGRFVSQSRMLKSISHSSSGLIGSEVIIARSMSDLGEGLCLAQLPKRIMLFIILIALSKHILEVCGL